MRKLAFFSVLLLFITQGCVTTVVFDNVLPPVNLSREGDKAYFTGAYGTNGMTLTGGITILSPLQFAFSVHRNVEKGAKTLPAVSAAGNIPESSMELESFEYLAGTYFELRENGVLEIFAGMGRGRGEEYAFSQETWDWKPRTILRTAKGDFEKMFLQINVGKRIPSSAYGLALRWNRVTFADYEKWHSERGTQFKGETHGDLWELTFFARIGGDVMKFGGYGTFSFTPHKIEFQHPQLTLGVMAMLTF